jgi:hypothetical protein
VLAREIKVGISSPPPVAGLLIHEDHDGHEDHEDGERNAIKRRRSCFSL